MTPEEVKQLKAGDRILIEAIVRNWSFGSFHAHLDEERGTVAIYTKSSDEETKYVSFVQYSDIREKIVPPRRKFKRGDIVEHIKSSYLFFVDQDEYSDGTVALRSWSSRYNADELKLICAVENISENNNTSQVVDADNTENADHADNIAIAEYGTSQYVDFIDKLRKDMLARYVTHKEFARRLGVSYSIVYHTLTGYAKASDRMMRKIINAIYSKSV